MHAVQQAIHSVRKSAIVTEIRGLMYRLIRRLKTC